MLESRMIDLNAELKKFKDEMVAQGMWDNCVVVVNSEFGRTGG